MAATPESKVKAAVRKVLDANGAYYFLPAANGFGRAGIPDIIACVDGLLLAIECKAGKGKTTAPQDRELAAIAGAGGHTFVIREDGLGYLKTMLKDCV